LKLESASSHLQARQGILPILSVAISQQARYPVNSCGEKSFAKEIFKPGASKVGFWKYGNETTLQKP